MNKRESLFIVFLAAVIIFLGGYKFLISPELKKLETKKGTLDAAEKDYNQAQIDISSVQSMESKIEQIKNKVEEESKIFFPSLESDIVHLFMEGLAEKSNIVFDSFTMSSKTFAQITNQTAGTASKTYVAGEAANNLLGKNTDSTGTPPPKTASSKTLDQIELITVSLQFSSTYENLNAFLNEIATSQRTVRVIYLDIRKTDTADLSASMTVECYGLIKLIPDSLSDNKLPAPSGKANPFD